MPIVLEWKKLTETSKGPTKGHGDDAGWDLYADCPEGLDLNPGETKIVSTGLAIVPPKNWHCDLRGRSGMNSKGKFVILGLIDSFYNGPWGVVLYNASKDPIKVNHHDKIAQFTLMPTYEAKLIEVEEFTVSGDRMASGFGSTGQ